MSTTAKTIVYPVEDLDTSKRIFGTLLGTEPHTDQPYYVGFNVDGQELALDPNGSSQGLTGPVPYWHVDDIAGTTTRLVEAGAEVVQPVRDVGSGKQLTLLADSAGNHIGLIQEP